MGRRTIPPAGELIGLLDAQGRAHPQADGLICREKDSAPPHRGAIRLQLFANVDASVRPRQHLMAATIHPRRQSRGERGFLRLYRARAWQLVDASRRF